MVVCKKVFISKLCRFLQDVILPCIIWAFIISLYYVCSDLLLSELHNSVHTVFDSLFEYVNIVKYILNSYCLFNISVCLLVLSLLCYLVILLHKNARIVNCIGALGFTAVIIICSRHYSFAKIFNISGSEIIFFSYLFAVAILLDVILKLNKAYQKNNKSKEIIAQNAKNMSLGFTTDIVNPSREETLRHQFAKNMITHLLNTDVSEEAYTVGITGGWGSGKTTFMNDMIQELNERAIVIKFNPWKYQSDAKLIEKFFQELSSHLRDSHLKVSQILIKYLRSLEISMPAGFFAFKNGIPFSNQESIEKLKSEIDNKLDTLDKKVFVFIDDLDRMKADEIFEILKIIRDTAKFHNIVYVVMMDKIYVAKQLEGLNIDNGTNYLEKIIELEIDLPKIEASNLVKDLENELKQMLNDTTNLNELISMFKATNIERYFDSYRKVKRFARSFAAKYNFIRQTEFGKQLFINDLFLLEIIHTISPDVYEQLKSDCTVYLTKVEEANKSMPYYITKDYGDNHPEINENVSKLLAVLFPDISQPNSNQKKNPYRMQFLENYELYFCLGIPGNILSYSEFETAIDNIDDNIGIVKSWCKSETYKQPYSVYNKATTYVETHSQDEINYENFFKLVLVWVLSSNEFGRYTELIIGYTTHLIKSKQLTDITKDINELVREIISEGNNVVIAKCLSILVEALYESNSQYHHDQFVSLIINNCETFIQQNYPLLNDPIDFVNKQENPNDYNLKNLALNSMYYAMDNNERTEINPTAEIIMKHLQNKSIYNISEMIKFVFDTRGLKSFNDDGCDMANGIPTTNQFIKSDLLIHLFGRDGFEIFKRYQDLFIKENMANNN